VAAILPFLSDQSAFDPEATHAMSLAFDEVCQALKVGGDARAREAIAVRIIELARCGERNSERLRDRLLKDANGGRS
jgi:hypothetical protein